MLRVAIIGFGRRGAEHAAAIQQVEGAQLVAAVDPAFSAAERAGLLEIPLYAEAESMLREKSPDMVIVATPPLVRAGPVRASASAGTKAIVVEKPLSLSVRETEDMIAACESAGSRLFVCHQLRFAPEFQQLAAAVARGEIGELRLLSGVCFGGLIDQGPHLFDTICWIAGDRSPGWVMSQSAADADRQPGSPPSWTTHHVAFEGGLRAVLEMGPLHQRSRPDRGPWLQKRVTAVGSEGVAEARAAGYFRLDSARCDPRRLEVSIADYQSATTAFLESVIGALRRNTPHPCEARMAMPSLQLLFAAAQSIVDQDLVQLPATGERDVIGELTMTRSPKETNRVAGEGLSQLRFSIVIPLEDHRGMAQRSVVSWTRHQSFPAGAYEVIVLGSAALTDRIRPMLRPPDRTIVSDGTNNIELYDIGARAAQGEFVVFTEPHCEAEPGCLAELHGYLERHPSDGACLRSVGFAESHMGRLEQQAFDEGFAEFTKPGDWRKVIVRGVAVRRSTFLKAGGFRYRYGRFAEWELAARLDRLGYALGYASGAAVVHHYARSVRHIQPIIQDFTRGECAYRTDHPERETESYFGRPVEFSRRIECDRAVALATARVGLIATYHLRSGPPGRFAAMGRTALRLIAACILGKRGVLRLARVRLLTAKMRAHFWRWNPDRAYRAYRDLWDRLATTGRLAWMLSEQVQIGKTPEGRMEAEEIPEGWLSGFHALEQADGQSFRWSDAVCALRLPLPPDANTVKIDTAGIRREGALPRVWVSLDGKRIGVTVEDRSITLSLPRTRRCDRTFHVLSIATEPLIPRRHGVADDRVLGFPLAALEIS